MKYLVEEHEETPKGTSVVFHEIVESIGPANAMTAADECKQALGGRPFLYDSNELEEVCKDFLWVTADGSTSVEVRKVTVSEDLSFVKEYRGERVRHIVLGFTETMKAGDQVTLRIEGMKLKEGILTVRWMVMSPEDLRARVMDLSAGYDYQKERGLILSNVMIADALKEIAARLESIDNAFRGTIG